MALILRFREIEKLVKQFTRTYPQRRGKPLDRPLNEIEDKMNDIYKVIKEPGDKRTYNRFIKIIEDYYSSDKFRQAYSKNEERVRFPDIEKFTEDVEVKMEKSTPEERDEKKEEEEEEAKEEMPKSEAKMEEAAKEEMPKSEAKMEEAEMPKSEAKMPMSEAEMEAYHDQLRKEGFEEGRQQTIEEFRKTSKEETEESKEETEETKGEPEETKEETKEETEDIEVEEASTDTIPKEENVNMMIMKDRERQKDDPTIGEIQIPKERLGIMGKNAKQLNDDIKYFIKRFPDILKIEADAYKKIDKKNLLALQDLHRRIQAKLSPDGEKKEGKIGIILDADKFIDMKISELLAAKTLEGLTPSNLVDITQVPKSQGKDIGSYTISKNRAGRDVINNAPVYRSIPTSQPPKPKRRGEIKQDTIYKNSGKDKVDIAKMEMASNPFIRKTIVRPLNIIL